MGIKIVDGEIVRDSDQSRQPDPPRASGPAAGPSSSFRSASAPPSTPAGGSSWALPFDWSARAIAVSPGPREESFFGWPGLDIFGAHLNSKHAVALACATAFFGLWGFLGGAGVWVAYKSYQPGAPTAPTAPRQHGNISQTAQAFLQSFLQPGPGHLQGPQQGPSGASASASAPVRSQPGRTDGQSWQGRGRGQKLGSAPS